jgi:hypothetical protein
VNSNYNSLGVKLTQRMSNGFTYLLGYTFGKSIDDGTAERIIFSGEDQSHTGVGQDRPNVVPGQTWRPSNRTPNEWFNVQALLCNRNILSETWDGTW